MDGTYHEERISQWAGEGEERRNNGLEMAPRLILYALSSAHEHPTTREADIQSLLSFGEGSPSLGFSGK
jgi:hypothetical protein